MVMKVLVEGWVNAVNIGFVLDADLKTEELAKLSQPQRYYLVFAALSTEGRGTSGHQLKVFLEDPPEEAKLARSTLETLSRSKGSFVTQIPVHRNSQVLKGSSSWWIVTNEQTLVVVSNEGPIDLDMWLKEIHDSVFGEIAKKRMSKQLVPDFTLTRRDALSTLEGILASPEYREEFRKYLRFAFAEENIDFVEAVDKYEKSSARGKRKFDEAVEIINQFIRETSEQQVNLPSDLKDELMEYVEKHNATGEVPNKDLLDHMFEPTKNEIMSLMKRNFLHRFQKMEMEKRQREKQLEIMSGSFGRVWQFGGLDGYKAILSHFDPVLAQCHRIGEYLNERMHVQDTQYKRLGESGMKFPLDVNRPPKLGSINRATQSVLSNFNMMLRPSAMFTSNVRNYVLSRLQELIITIQTSLSELQEKYNEPLTEMDKARQKHNEILEKLREANANLKLAEQELAVASSGKKAKNAKKIQQKVDQCQKIALELDAKREEAEIEVVTSESKYSDLMLGAMEQLESLELHRLDTMASILQQLGLAEQELLQATGLALEPSVADSIVINPVQEILDLAEQVQGKSLSARPPSFRPPMGTRR